MWQKELNKNGLRVLEIKPFQKGMILSGLRSNFNIILFRKEKGDLF
jgi:hypothetical protein